MSAGHITLTGPVVWPDGRSTTVEAQVHAIVCDHAGCLAAHVGNGGGKNHELDAAYDGWLLGAANPSPDYCPTHRGEHEGGAS